MMVTHLSSLVKASVYYLIAFGLAVLVALLGQRLGGLANLVVTMLTPVTAVLLMLLVITPDGYTRAGWQMLGLHRLGLRSWGLAILAPIVVMSFTYGIVWSTGIGRLDLTRLGDAFSGGPVNLVLGLLVSMVPALGEEIGWRGYLLPNLLPLGRTRALLVSGFMHGLYHLPLLLLTPFYHESGNRFVVASLFVLTLTAAGVFYGYLRLTSASVWPAAVAHTVFNTVWTIYTVLTVAVASPLALEYLAGESGVLTLIGVAVASGWLLYRLGRLPQAVLATGTAPTGP